MKDTYRILAINPGSTSTKIAVFDNEKPLLEKVIRYASEELAQFDKVIDQLEFRRSGVLAALADSGIDLAGLDAVVGRGGLLKPIEGGTYAVNDLMLAHLAATERGEHAANLGAAIAEDIARHQGIPAYIVDPVVVDELADVARLSGLPGYDRSSIFHALNQKAVARRYAKEQGKRYDELNLIIAHLGGGISVGVHQGGRVIDVNDALQGEGPFSPERAGGLPTKHVVSMCYSGASIGEVNKKMVGRGGLIAYLGTSDGREVVKRIEAGDAKAKLVYEAMAYQIAKEIGAGAVVLYGRVDAIILTGGLAYDKLLTTMVTERVKFIGEVKIFPGEDEMIALAEGALRVLEGEEAAKEYN